MPRHKAHRPTGRLCTADIEHMGGIRMQARGKKEQAAAESAVRFLTRTFRNVIYVPVGKLIVRLWRSQRSRTVV